MFQAFQRVVLRTSRESVQVSYGPGVPSQDRTRIGIPSGTQEYPREAVLTRNTPTHHPVDTLLISP